MNIREINRPITAKSLNESLAKRFGKKIALEQFTIEQLQNVRNKIRTTLSQVETNESFDTVQSESYQKNKLFLDVLNAEISERADIQEEGKPDFPDLDKDGDTKEPMKKAAKEAGKGKSGKPKKGKVPPQFKKKANESLKEKAVCKECGDEFGKATTECKNDCNDPTLDCWVKESEYKKMNESSKRKDDMDAKGKAKKGKASGKGDQTKSADGFDPFNRKKNPVVKKQGFGNYNPFTDHNESIVREGAEDQAELVMAAKNMVDRVTSWMEDTAEMQTESMLELADAIRDEKGQEASDAYVNTVKPALESLYGTMETTRQALTQGVGQMTGEMEPEPQMGAEPEGGDVEMDMEPTVDADAEEPFAAADAAVGGEAEAGREKRESVQRKKKVIETSRRLGTILSKKK